MMGRTRAVATLLLALTFMVGGLAGMALEEALGIDWFEFLDDQDDEASDQLLAGFDLSAEQRARAERILDDEEDRLEAYWEARLPEILAERRRTHAEIRAMLAPAQQETFDRRVRDLDDRVPGIRD
jgi:hypothetical protein